MMRDSGIETDPAIAGGRSSSEVGPGHSIAGTQAFQPNGSCNYNERAEQVAVTATEDAEKRYEKLISKETICHICLNLDCTAILMSTRHTSGPGQLRLRERQLSEFRTSKNDGCGFCAILLTLCEGVPMIDEASQIEIQMNIFRGKMMVYISSKKKTINSFELYRPMNSSPTTPLMMRFPEVRDISAEAGSKECFAFAKSCVGHCIENHDLCREFGGACLPNRTIYLGSDNSSLRLVQHAGQTRAIYTALSYCWGTGNPMKTTMATLSSREANLSWDSMPPVFQDAITVTREFGVEHLWIDALCIIQDSPEDWQVQSSKMANIFAGAFFTIAAVSPRSCSIPFLTPRPKCYSKPLIIPVDRDAGYIKARSIVPPDYTNTGPLNTRAWAYQERVLSARVLIYMEEELIWQCRMGITCECQTHTKHALTTSIESASGPDDFTTFLKVANLNDPRVSDPFRSWQVGVSSYTHRNLTYSSDKLPALAGIADVVHKRTGSAYIAGLWRDNLLSDLQWKVSWYPDFGDASPGCIACRSAPTVYQAPTFSWASVDIEVYYDYPRTNVQYQASILDVNCSLKGLNLFGEVTGGFIKLEGPVFRQILETTWLDPRDPLYCKLYHNAPKSKHTMYGFGPDDRSWPGLSIFPDGPLRQINREGENTTVQRLRKNEFFSPFTASIDCLGLCYIPGELYVALMLGESTSVPGAYERLGILRWFAIESDNESTDSEAINRCYSYAKTQVVTIV